MAAQAIMRHGWRSMATRELPIILGEKLSCTYFRTTEPEPMMLGPYGDDRFSD